MKQDNLPSITRSSQSMMKVGKVLAILIAIIIFAYEQGVEAKKQEVGVFESPCGTTADVAARVGECLSPLMDLIYGRLPVPRNDEESVGICNRFINVESCARKVGHECSTGIQRTAILSVGSSAKKFRSKKCKTLQARAPIVPTLQCLDKHPVLPKIFKKNAALAQGITRLNVAPEQRLNGICCMLDNIEKDMKKELRPLCPKELYTMSDELFHALIDDLKTILCTKPHCEGVLESVANHKLIGNHTIIEPIVETVILNSI